MQLKSMLGQQQLQRQQLQGAQIENQMRSQQLKDSQLYGKALLNSDPSNPESMLQYFVKNGGSGQGAMQLQQMLLARRKQLSDIAASDATTGAKNLETLKGTNDLIAGQLHSLQSLPDDQLPQAFASTAQNLAKMDPNGQQHFQQLSQVRDPNQLRQGLKVLEYSYLGDSALADRELKGAQTQEAIQKGNEAQVQGQKALAELQFVGKKPGENVPYSPEVFAQRKALRQSVNITTADDLQNTVGAIKNGQAPPDIKQYSFRDRTAIAGRLAKQGFNLAQATTDWNATQKHIATMNGSQQLRLNQAINALPDLADKIEGLYNEWSQLAPVSGYKILNKATLTAMKNLPGRAGAVAQALDAQINDAVSDLAVVYMGGNSPTDHGLGLAKANLSSEWSQETFKEGLKQLRANVAIRKNSILNAGVAGASPDNMYAPQQGQQVQPSGKEVHYKIVNGQLVAQ